MPTSRLAELLLELVSIPSVIRDERALCDNVEQRLRQAPLELKLTRVGDSIAAVPSVRRHPHLLALVGHLDTVPKSADNPPRIEGDRVFGLGSSDMKAGDALMLALLDEPLEQADTDIAWIFYDGEEGPYDKSGLGPLLEALPSKDDITLAICLEPSDNELQLGCLGTLHAEVTFAGRAAHSARPWQGQNAVHAAGPLLSELARRQPVTRVFSDSVFGSVSYREVVSATLATGGTARNVVPASFVLNINFRFAPGRSVDSAKQYVRDLVDATDAKTANITFIDVAPAGDIPRKNPLLDRFVKRCAPPIAAKQAWTDVGRLSSCGIDAINFGPGESAQAHQPNESTSISLLDQGYVQLKKICGLPNGR